MYLVRTTGPDSDCLYSFWSKNSKTYAAKRSEGNDDDDDLHPDDGLKHR